MDAEAGGDQERRKHRAMDRLDSLQSLTSGLGEVAI
jgi:hypothetical protein